MNTLILRSFVLFFLWIYCIATTSVKAGDLELKMWKKDYPGALSRVKKSYSRATAKGFLNRKVESQSLYTISLASFDRFQKTSMLIEKDVANRRVLSYQIDYVLNPDDVFQVQRAEQKSGQYYITKFATNDPVARSDAYRYVRTGFVKTGGRFFFAPFSADWLKMDDLLDENQYKVSSAENIVDSGEKMMRIRFITANPARPPIKGEVDFLIDRFWVIRRATVDMSSYGKSFVDGIVKQLNTTMTVDYDGDQMDVPVPKRVVFADGLGKMTCDFDEFRLGTTTPEQQFRLGYYGLNDLRSPVVDPSRGRFIYWLLGLSIATLIGFFVIRKFSK